MPKFIDLTGQKFGRLTVIERAPNNDTFTQPATLWRCKCDCGNEVVVRSYDLRKGRTKSCGCYQREAVSKYIQSSPEIRAAWRTTKGYCHRCGIELCFEWKHDFYAFESWAIENGYLAMKKPRILRIDRNGAFSPSNCVIKGIKEFCPCCHEDADGHVSPIEKNCHAYWKYPNKLVVKFGKEQRECAINYCPMCGRRMCQ